MFTYLMHMEKAHYVCTFNKIVSMKSTNLPGSSLYTKHIVWPYNTDAEMSVGKY